MDAEDQLIHEGSDSSIDLVRAHVMVSGQVQGVAYRAFTQQQAMHLNLHGWVRNLHDGQVEAEVEGSRVTVDRFLAFLQKGPPLAHVEHVQVKWIPVMNDSGEFCIVRS